MTTTCRPLNIAEQSKLWTLMKYKKITQTMIAKKANLKYPELISRVCRGVYNVTPRILVYFKTAGIDLKEIMGD